MTKVIMVAKVNMTAKIEVEIEITICQNIKILHTIAAKR